MNKKMHHLLVGLILTFSLSCNFFTGLIPDEGTSGSGEPLVARGNGPAGLTVEATSADSVALSWQPVEGATSYHIAVGIAGGDALPVMDLKPSVTSYEDFLAMPGSQLTYAVEALSDTGSIGQSVVDVTTPERQPNPLTVDAQLDSESIEAATIGPEGGSISLTDGRGVTYKLEIPAGALDTEIVITLTAVKNIGGWPLDGDMLGAVKIEPDGLVLNDVATLSISLPDVQPSNELKNLGFAFSGNGTEFHLKPAFDQNAGTGLLPGDLNGGHLSSPARQTGAEIVMETLVMYGVGVGQGSAESAAALVKSNAPTDAGAALQQKEATAHAGVDEIAADSNINLYEDQLVDAAGTVQVTIMNAQDCGDVRSAMGSVSGWLWEAKFRNLDPALIQTGHDLMVGDLADKIKQVLDEAGDKCKKAGKSSKSSPPGTGCAKGLIKSLITGNTQLLKDIRDKMLKDYGSRELDNRDADLDSCNRAFSVNSETPGGQTLSGNICDLQRTFTLTQSGGPDGIYTFYPVTPNEGMFTGLATGADSKFIAGGKYKINGIDSESPTLRMDFNEHVITPLTEADHSLSGEFPLIPLEGACK